MDGDKTWQERMLLAHDKDLYHGDGKPGLTTRTQINEEDIKELKEESVRRRDDWKKIIFMFLATMLSGAVTLILHLLGK
jgi:hypothetical protein